MTSTIMNFARGMIAGVVVGTTVGVVLTKAARPVNPLKKNTTKALKAVNHFMENITGK